MNDLLIWISLASIFMFFGSLVVGWVLIVRMPVDYLTREIGILKNVRHPVVYGVILVLKSAIGLALIALGIVMLFTPGQGIMAIFIGITLLEFPGKRKLIRRMLRRRGILKLLNRIRAKANKPPLDTPDH